MAFRSHVMGFLFWTHFFIFPLVLSPLKHWPSLSKGQPSLPLLHGVCTRCLSVLALLTVVSEINVPTPKDSSHPQYVEVCLQPQKTSAQCRHYTFYFLVKLHLRVNFCVYKILKKNTYSFIVSKIHPALPGAEGRKEIGFNDIDNKLNFTLMPDAETESPSPACASVDRVLELTMQILFFPFISWNLVKYFPLALSFSLSHSLTLFHPSINVSWLPFVPSELTV